MSDSRKEEYVVITVTITENGLTIDGHAGYAEIGKDIVCAAVSSCLLYTSDAADEL